MKHPWWLVNSALFILLIITMIFVISSQQKRPVKNSFEPSEIKQIKRDLPKIDLSKIYNNDLFGTYQTPVTIPTVPEKEILKPVPQPPMFKEEKAPMMQPPRFLEPLQINLKGIIVGNDESLNRAIIEENKEKISKNYKIGDKIDDAYLMRILKNKIILIRSNGQQETLYVSPHDAEMEQLLSPKNNWSQIIEKISDYVYKVDPYLFIERVHNLAQFIDLLNITTVYHQGSSIGCRIGKIQQGSPTPTLGLLPGDIIETINNISTSETNNRFEIYKEIVSMNIGDTITITVRRKQTSITITYVLEKSEQQDIKEQQKSSLFIPETSPKESLSSLKSSLMQEKNNFETTLREMHKNEKQTILNNGKKMGNIKRRNILVNNLQTE